MTAPARDEPVAARTRTAADHFRKDSPMSRRPVLAAAAFLTAGVLALSACSGGGGGTAPSGTGEPDPDASVAIRLVLEPGNLDIRQTSGAALDQILVDNVY